MPLQRILPAKERKRYEKPCMLDAKERKSVFTLNEEGIKISTGIRKKIGKVIVGSVCPVKV